MATVGTILRGLPQFAYIWMKHFRKGNQWSGSNLDKMLPILWLAPWLTIQMPWQAQINCKPTKYFKVVSKFATEIYRIFLYDFNAFIS